MKQKVHIVAAQHGDEIFGLKIIGKMQQQSSDGFSFRVANPEAVAENKRYLESDMNRSYGEGESTIERRLAIRLKEEITQYAPDLIIDLHTSVSDVDKVGVIAKPSRRLVALAQFLGMTHVVVIPDNLSKGSLIGTFPDNSIALEFGHNSRSDILASEVASRLRSLNCYRGSQLNQVDLTIPVFEVRGTIDKKFKNLNGIRNLVFNKKLDGYPFLAGPNTYGEIGGFIAAKVDPRAII